MKDTENIVSAIASIEAQRAVLGDEVVEEAVRGLRERLAAISGTERRPPAPGERKLVTIMFADVTAFTAMSETLDPERVRALMNACFNALVPCVEKYGGVVDKFLGDAVMALFGAPVTHEDDPERALRAAIEMLDALVAFNARTGTNVGMHFGINTGPVVAGGLGSDGRQQYSVMGDTVNTASRLADAADDGQVMVGSNTFRLTSALFDFTAVPDIKLKGRTGLVTGYRLRGRKLGLRVARGTPDLRSPMVGRADELRRLQAALQDALEGRGAVIAVCGDPGLGKSRLIAEFRDIAQGECARTGIALHWAEGRNQSYTSGTSYGVVQRLLDDLVGVKPDAPIVDIDAALRSTLDEVVPRERFVDIYPYLAHMRDLPLDAASQGQIDQVLPATMQSRMLRAFAELLRGLAARRPVVMVWEDLHWIDPSSLGLLESVLSLTERLSILLLLTFRPNEGGIDAWYRQRLNERSVREPIELLPLDNADSERLMGNVFAVANFPDATRRLILERAEGNPFFVEELVRSLVDAGAVILEGKGGYATEALSRIEIPATLQGVIAARIDRLPANDKRVLQSASVLGRIFQQNVLARLLGHEEAGAQLAVCLSDLETRELVRRSTVEWEYLFKHAITHDVTYNSLLYASRRQLHAVAAEAIEDLFPDRVDELAATLALHYTRGEAPAKAVHYFKRAATRARQTYSNAEAIAFYRAALEQAASLSGADIAGLHEELGRVLALIGRGEEARESYRQARKRLGGADFVVRARLHRLEAVSFMAQRQPDKSLQACFDAEAVLNAGAAQKDAAWHDEWLEIRFERAFAHYWLNQVRELVELDDEMRPVVLLHGTARQRSRYYRALFTLEMRRMHYAISSEGMRYAEAAMAAAKEAGMLPETISAALGLGIAFEMRAEWKESERHLREGLQLAERVGDQEMIVTILLHLTNVHRLQQSVDAVRALATRTLEAAEAARMPPYISNARNHLAWVAWREGRGAEAKQVALAALKMMGDTPIPRCYGLWPLIAITTAEDRPDEAIGHCRALLAPFEIPRPDVLDRALRAAIDAFEHANPDATRARLQETVKLAQESGWL